MITAVLDDASGDLADVLDPVATTARSTVAARIGQFLTPG
jgi:hypothetical protein